MASRNGWKGGERPILRRLAKLLGEQRHVLREVQSEAP